VDQREWFHRIFEYTTGKPKNLSYYLTGVNEHIVPLSFEGWKYFSLCEENIGEYTSIEFKNNTAGPYKRYREYMTYKAVSDMRILLTATAAIFI
jgi:hypothetical protein